jgi:hypothetical protein
MRALLLLLLLAAPLPAVGADLPVTECRRLTGEALTLPGALAAQTLLVLTFQRDQFDDMRSWAPVVTRLAEERGLEHLALPILPRAASWLRRVIDPAMAKAIEPHAHRHRTATCYTDKEAFMAGVGVSDEARVVLVLVDATGRVTWRGAGPRAPATEAALVAALAR